MKNDYEFNLKKVNMRSSLLSYKDNEGTVEVYLEESAVPEFDWIGAEPDFKENKERLKVILSRLKEWSKNQELKI